MDIMLSAPYVRLLITTWVSQPVRQYAAHPGSTSVNAIPFTCLELTASSINGDRQPRDSSGLGWHGTCQDVNMADVTGGGVPTARD